MFLFQNLMFILLYNNFDYIFHCFAGQNELIDSIFDFASNFSNLDLDEINLALFTALVLVASGNYFTD